MVRGASHAQYCRSIYITCNGDCRVLSVDFCVGLVAIVPTVLLNHENPKACTLGV